VASQSTYSISGAVNLGGIGLSGVSISAGTRQAITDSSGSYALTGLPNGIYPVVPSRVGYTFAPASLTVEILSSNTYATFAAYLADGGVTDGGSTTADAGGAGMGFDAGIGTDAAGESDGGQGLRGNGGGCGCIEDHAASELVWVMVVIVSARRRRARLGCS
jgi:hypothetical protein